MKTVTKIPNKKLSIINRKSVLARWESVRQEREDWLKPFYDLPIDEAMAFLENLRDVCCSAGEIMNMRISKDTRRMVCAGGCGKDLSGVQPNGRPTWVAKKDFRDRIHPEIIHSLYYCSAYCNEKWVRMQQAACRCGHIRGEHGFGIDQKCAHCVCKKYVLASRAAIEVSGVIS